MARQENLQKDALDWILELPAGTEFGLDQLYRYLETSYPDETSLRGDAKTEPRFKNDARWAVQAAVDWSVIERKRRGIYQRTNIPRELLEVVRDHRHLTFEEFLNLQSKGSK